MQFPTVQLVNQQILIKLDRVLKTPVHYDPTHVETERHSHMLNLDKDIILCREILNILTEKKNKNRIKSLCSTFCAYIFFY